MACHIVGNKPLPKSVVTQITDILMRHSENMPGHNDRLYHINLYMYMSLIILSRANHCEIYIHYFQRKWREYKIDMDVEFWHKFDQNQRKYILCKGHIFITTEAII